MAKLAFSTTISSLLKRGLGVRATFALSFDTDSVILVRSKIEALAPGFAPGLTCLVNVNLPNQNSGKIELQYFRGLVSLSSSLGLFNNPMFGLSGVVGNDTWTVGADVALNTNNHQVTTVNGGCSWSWDRKIASLTIEEKGRFVKGQYYHAFSSTSTSIGTEWSFNVHRRRLYLAFGVQQHFGSTELKARINKQGIAGFLQHNWTSESFFRVSMQKRHNERGAILGVSLAFVA